MRRGRLLLLSVLLPFACSAPSRGSESVSGFSSGASQSGSDEAILRAKAVRGDAEAQYNLASMYFYGQDVKRDDAQAVQWFRRAAEQGRADAQTFLAMMYRAGRGVTLDFVQAAAWARKSAEQGHPRGQGLLGIMSFDGQGVSKDAVEGYKWETLSAARATEEDVKRFASNAVEIMANAMTREEIAKAETRAREWVSARQAMEDTVREMALKAFCGEVGDELYFVKVEEGLPSPILLKRLRGDPRYRSFAAAQQEKQTSFGVPVRGSVIRIGPIDWQSERKARPRLSTYKGPLDAFAAQFLVERDGAGRWSASIVPGSAVVS